VQGLRIFLSHFGQPRELIVLLEASDASAAGSLVDSLATELRSSPGLIVRSAPPWMENPRDLVPLAAFLLLNQAPDQFQTTLERLSPAKARDQAATAIERLSTTMAPEEIARLAYDPLNILSALPTSATPDMANREFSSADGRTRLLYVSPDTPTPPRDWVKRTAEVIRHWQSSSRSVPKRM
jgi:hypothetical protein